MSYLPYVIAAYAVFLLMLLIDALGAWRSIARAHRLLLQHGHQLQARRIPTTPTPSQELER